MADDSPEAFIRLIRMRVENVPEVFELTPLQSWCYPAPCPLTRPPAGVQPLPSERAMVIQSKLAQFTKLLQIFNS